MSKKGSKAETIIRSQKFARIIANGGRRSDCVRYAAENWGVGERACCKYINIAREELKKDWDMERPQMVADLLAQCSTLQMEARRAGHYHIALRYSKSWKCFISNRGL